MTETRRRILRGCAASLALLLGTSRVHAGTVPDEADAARELETHPCGTGTIGSRLGDELRSHSRRDLGWRLFGGDGHYDLERSQRLSKSMELRFRWRVHDDGKIEPVSEPAQRLCH